MDEEWMKNNSDIKEKDRKVVHVIITTEKHVGLNWAFLNQKHPQPQVRYINVPQSSSLRDYQKIFADEIFAEYESPVEIETIRFWTPKEHLPIDTYMETKTNHDVTVFANPVTLTKSFPSALAERLNDATIVHIVVTAEEKKSNSKKEDEKDQPLPESLRLQCEEEETIYDGRSSALTRQYTLAPPIEIYHRIFNTFLRLVEDPPQPTADDLNNTRELMQYLCELSDGDAAKSDEDVLSMLYNILKQNLRRMDKVFLNNKVCIWAGDEYVPILIVELEEELGEGNCDPSTQADLSMKHFWSMDRVKKVREKCCCPTFLLSGGGPWIGIIGAVFTDRVIVQRLTDIRWFGLSSTAEDKRLWANTCILLALRETLKQLTHFYERDLFDIRPWIPHGPHPRFYPHPTSYPYASPDGTRREIKFEYQRALDDYSGCSLNTLQNTAEGFLADLNYAPKLFYYGPLPDTPSFESISNAAQNAHPGLCLRPDTMYMVVMEYIESGPDPEVFRWQLEEILFKLREEGYAFGDFRLQNILKDFEGNIKLIDFNWCGEYDTEAKRDGDRLQVSKYVRDKLGELDRRGGRATTGPYAYYPSSLSLLPNEWPHGVGSLKPILPEHDWALLEKLFLKEFQ
ncbi:hypothetical protein Clacol_001108 [Clathrus columnatus]|uniref:Protein kinase domain-containing protein n=1 Tax=Clathrus columnatus TaxID=1419009 RepID=A0AAV5A0H2_9AGAM|nr:hypothetical protein Clacol_001108 [Clathrus columnatus]